MKFRSSATIAIYFLFTILWVILITHASDEKEIGFGELSDIKREIKSLQQKIQELISPELEVAIISKTVQHNFTKRLEFLNQIKQRTRSLQHILPPPYKLLNEFNSGILSLIFDHFLTMRDIIILQQTCKEFSTFLKPNEQNMVMYCKNVRTKEMINVQLMYFDLKYFLDESYYTAFDPVEMFNIKTNQYTMLTGAHDKQIIPWINAQASYPQMLFYEARKELTAKEPDFSLMQYDPPKIYNNLYTAWAKITKDSNVVTGGNENDGGDSNHVQSQLKNVKIIISTRSAFAALLENGKVVAWGDINCGGLIPDEIQNHLQNVKMIVSTDMAFAALLENGDVVSWGNKAPGGHLQNVKDIVAGTDAFAALIENGVFAWGNFRLGGHIPPNIQTELQNVKMIVSTNCAFSALLENRNVVAWGHRKFGGIIPNEIQNQLNENVKLIASTDMAFAILLDNGNVLAWGEEHWGGKIPNEIRTQLQNVKMIFSNSSTFVALLQDNSIISWGDNEIPTDIQLKSKKNVKMIFSNTYAFAALLLDGSVFAWPDWGTINYGGTIPDDIQPKLIENVTTIIPEPTGFTAICKTGEMIKWGFSPPYDE